jgi:hypothetical protein
MGQSKRPIAGKKKFSELGGSPKLINMKHTELLKYPSYGQGFPISLFIQKEA